MTSGRRGARMFKEQQEKERKCMWKLVNSSMGDGSIGSILSDSMQALQQKGVAVVDEPGSGTSQVQIDATGWEPGEVDKEENKEAKEAKPAV